MILTHENYNSIEANKEYMSNSQLQGFLTCEAQQIAKINGEWEQEEIKAFTEGKFLDHWNNGTLEEFKANNPDLYLKNGLDLKAEYRHLGDVIEFISKDPLLMESLSGEKQRIFTAELFGVPWKIAIDSYFERQDKREGRIVDLKYLKSLYDRFWTVNEDGIAICEKTLEHRGYLDQVAIYCKIEQLKMRPDKTVKVKVYDATKSYPDYYEPFITAITKSKPYPDKEVISFSTEGQPYHEFIEYRLSMIQDKMPRIIAVKAGKVEPKRCGMCQYCLSTKILKGTTHYTFFLD
jgi:hypothetical protein